MTIGSGVETELRYKKESAFAVAPGASGAQLLRRVLCDLALRKQTYESNEIVRHKQRVDMRHGVRSVEGGVQGELSAGTWEDFLAAALRRDFTAVSALTSLSLTIAASGSNYTITRGSGDWLAGGIKAGQVGRLTAGTFDTANLNKNLLVLSATTTVLTVRPLNGVALVAEGPIASATWTIPGKITYAPLTGHTDDSFSIERWHSDAEVSQLFRGCKVNQLDVSLPPTGMASIALQMMGVDVTKAAAEYFTTPTAETETGVLAAVNGLVVVQGTPVAIVTGLNFSVRGNMSAEPVIGSNVYADIAEGRIVVDGQATVLFEDDTMLDYFLDETEVGLIVALSASPAAAADFMTFALPRVKFGGADVDDGDKQLVQSLPFTALLNVAGGASTDDEESTMAVQDSQA